MNGIPGEDDFGDGDSGNGDPGDPDNPDSPDDNPPDKMKVLMTYMTIQMTPSMVYKTIRQMLLLRWPEMCSVKWSSFESPRT